MSERGLASCVSGPPAQLTPGLKLQKELKGHTNQRGQTDGVLRGDANTECGTQEVYCNHKLLTAASNHGYLHMTAM